MLAVCQEERCARVWDWARRRCAAAKRLWEEPLCCGLHPSGAVALVGTVEKLLVFHVTRVSARAGARAVCKCLQA